MARKDALLKLHRRLVDRRAELLRSIEEELGDLRMERGGSRGGDDGDAAASTLNAELASKVAQMESRELLQIDRAIARLREGKYGTCEICEKKIPVARLNALPYTTLCIGCQRELETNPDASDEYESGWQKVYDSEAASSDVSYKISDLEYKLG